MATTFRIRWLNETPLTTTSPMRWLWHGYLLAGSITLLTSRWKSGKTTLLSVLLAKMATGGELAAAAVSAGRAVVVTEEHETTWGYRNDRLALGSHIGLVTRPFLGIPSLQDWQNAIAELVEQYRERPFDLLVIDPLSPCLPAHSENQASCLLAAMIPLRQLADRGVSVLLLHHPRKASSGESLDPRGSGALSGFADMLMELERPTDGPPADRRRWLRARSRYAETVAERLIEWNESGNDYFVISDAGAQEYDQGWHVLKTVLEDAPYKLTRLKILSTWPEDHLKPHAITLWKWLDRAVGDGRVCRQGAGRCRDPFVYWLPGHEDRLWPDLAPLEPIQPLDRLDLIEADARAAAALAEAARRKMKRKAPDTEATNPN